MSQVVKVYLDTSVISAYFDQRAHDRMLITQRFWPTTLQPSYDFAVSPIVVGEINQTRTAEQRGQMLGLIRGLTMLTVTEAAQELAEAIIKANIVPGNKPEDSLHLAIAVEQGMDVLVSWNFRHMMKEKTIRMLPLVCVQMGYPRSPAITSPMTF